MERLGALADNFRRITSVNRNVGFFSTGYNWLIQLIPILIIAPAFMRGEVEFGVITQSALAFTTLVAAFSLIVTQFQSLSTYAAVVSRLGSLVDAIERKPPSSASGIGIVEAAGRLAFKNLTLWGSDPVAPLLKELSVEIPKGKRTLIVGSNPAAGRALFRATAGAQVSGSGGDHPPASGRYRLSAAATLHASGKPSPDLAGRRDGSFGGRTDRRSFTVARLRCVASAGWQTRPRAGPGRAPFLA